MTSGSFEIDLRRSLRLKLILEGGAGKRMNYTFTAARGPRRKQNGHSGNGGAKNRRCSCSVPSDVSMNTWRTIQYIA